MNKLRFVLVVLLAVIFAVPPGLGPVEARAAGDVSLASYVPQGGAWTGKTNLGYPVTFTVNSIGTAWTNFSTSTRIALSGICTVALSSNVTGPRTISASKFSGTTVGTDGTTLRFAGTFTSTVTASGTFSWTNVNGKLKCTQTGTWTAHGPFSKKSPANGATNQVVSPTLTWGASAGAKSYTYCIDQVNNGLCDASWISTGTHTTVIPAALLPGTKYYWQVRAINGALITPANSGVWWSFTTGALPGTFAKSSPTNGATGQALASTLQWGASPGATNYLYCFDTVNDGLCNTAWTAAGNATTVDPPGVFLPGTTYYWQVRAVNAIGSVQADGGTWWSFTTVPPSVLTLASLGSADGWVLESTSTSGVGGLKNAGNTTFALGDDAFNRQYRGILYFRTALLPSGAVITSVTLRFKRAGGTPSNPFLTLGNIVADIKKGTFGLAGLQSTDFQALASKTAVLTFTNTPVSGWYARALAAGDFRYINRTGPTQFRLRFARDSNNNKVANNWTFYSGNAGALNQPQLVIQYYIP